MPALLEQPYEYARRKLDFADMPVHKGQGCQWGRVYQLEEAGQVAYTVLLAAKDRK